MLNLNLPILVLASASPRRQELFSLVNIPFTVVKSEVEEIHLENPSETVTILALKKAEDVAKKVSENSIVVGADTIVFLENEILGKPENEEEAKKMLKKLSGKTHTVFTGFAILHKAKKVVFCEKAETEVKFKELSEAEINFYVQTGEPLDKAGAYGIQGIGSIFIEKINGCYFNVMGFPLNRFYEAMKNIYG
ncbi:septum formation inhibitor Maf [bacterium]|nr:septum formation inhibitor Maf [bacterium]